MTLGKGLKTPWIPGSEDLSGLLVGAALISLFLLLLSGDTGWSLHLSFLQSCHSGGSAAEPMAAGPIWELCI